MQLTVEAARAFAARWLPAWSGNDPDRLAGFYAEDTFYADPAVPDGIRGRDALLEYFRKLLARNPDWVWTQRDAIPMEGGFLNLWHAVIPLEGRTVAVDGVCLVQLNDEGLIVRNEVHFDRSLLAQDGDGIHDETTGLPNRRLLLDRLERALIRSERDQSFGAVLLVTLSSPRVVPGIAEHLQLLVRGRDTVARLDYDKLAVVLEGLSKGIDTALANAERVSGKVRTVLAEHDEGATIGSAMFRGLDKEPAALLAAAEKAKRSK